VSEVAYAFTRPSPVALQDFGRSPELHDGDDVYAWKPVVARADYAPPGPARLDSWTPLFARPVQTMTLDFESPSCEGEVFLVRLAEKGTGRTFRIVVRGFKLETTPPGHCINDYVALNVANLAGFTAQRLERTRAAPARTPAEPPAAPATSTTPATPANEAARALSVSTRYPPLEAALRPLRTLRADGPPPDDFRLAQYSMLNADIAREVGLTALSAKQALILLSDDVLRMAASKGALMNLFGIAKDFPAYIVLRSPIAAEDVHEHMVMHLKAYAVGSRYAQHASSSFDSPEMERFEHTLETSRPEDVAQVRRLILQVLTGEPVPKLSELEPVARGAVAGPLEVHYNFPLVFETRPGDAAGGRAAAYVDDAANALRSAKGKVVVSFLHATANWFWEALAASDAESILVVFNAGEDASAVRNARERLSHGKARVAFVGIGSETSTKFIVHTRSAVLGDGRCLLSEATFGGGTSFSDQSFVLTQDPAVCGALGREFRAMMGDTEAQGAPPVDRALPDFFFGKGGDLGAFPSLRHFSVNGEEGGERSPAENWRAVAGYFD
jgi:hypothetical protein